MKCPSCKFKCKNGTQESTWDYEENDRIRHKEFFYTIRGKYDLERDNSERKEEVDLNVCPKCGTVFVEHYWIHE